jgi:hypothetical protein
MKRIIYLSLILPLLIISCESTPEASFSVDTVEPEVGQVVFFNNNSNNAKSFEWDFGDGYISNEANPSHIFTATGTVEVTLTVISKNGLEDQASLILDIMIPTLLEIEVYEYYDVYPVENASVILYPTLPDWDGQTNSIAEGFTNANGIVVFSHLDPFVHYVDVWEQYHDNYALKSEDVGFIRTPEILPHHINRFTAWVDYVDHGVTKKGTRQLIIKKLERKVSDKKQPETNYGTEGWQELYNMSSNK